MPRALPLVALVAWVVALGGCAQEDVRAPPSEPDVPAEDAPSTLDFSDCMGTDVLAALPPTHEFGTPPPGWTRPTQVHYNAFLWMAKCNEASVPGHAGPLTWVIEGHDGFSEPAHCRDPRASGFSVLHWLAVDNASAAATLADLLGIPVDVIGLRLTATAAGKEVRLTKGGDALLVGTTAGVPLRSDSDRVYALAALRDDGSLVRLSVDLGMPGGNVQDTFNGEASPPLLAAALPQPMTTTAIDWALGPTTWTIASFPDATCEPPLS